MRLALVALARLTSCRPRYGWIAAVHAWRLFICTAGVMPISEAALAHLVSPAARSTRPLRPGARLGLDRLHRRRRRQRLRAAAARASQRSRGSCSRCSRSAAGRRVRLPAVARGGARRAGAAPGALAVLRQPVVAWFFAGVFFTVLAHTSLYAFFSLYLVSLGYSKAAIGLIWAVAVVVEVAGSGSRAAGSSACRCTAGCCWPRAGVGAALRASIAAFGGNVAGCWCWRSALHALTFAAQHTACIAVITRHFPGRLRGRGQALYTVLGYGARACSAAWPAAR